MRAGIFFSSKHGKWRWWNLFTGYKYAHCWVVFEEGTCVSVNPLIWGIQVSFYDGTLEDYINEVNAQAVYTLDIDYNPVDNTKYRGLYSCVSITKAMLGINDWRILTPKQLKNFLDKCYVRNKRDDKRIKKA